MALFKRSIKTLKSDEYGVAAIETAIFLPLVSLLVMSIGEFGMIMFVSALTEGGLRESSRFGITGREVEVSDRSQYIRNMIDEHTLGLLDMEKATIDVKTYPSFADIDTGEPFIDGNGNSQYDEGETYTDSNDNGAWDADVGVDGAGDAGEVVLYRVTTSWKLLTPGMSSIIGTDGYISLASSVTVRNEPWEN